MDMLVELRDLIIAQMGDQHHTYVQAAQVIGVTDGALHHFIKGTYKGIGVEMCLKLAKYLGVPGGMVLRMAGHEDIAALLEDIKSEPDDIYTRELAKVIDQLDPVHKLAIIENARSMAKIFRDTTPKYIGGKDGPATT